MTSIPQSQSIVLLENDQRGQKTDSDGNCAKSTSKLLKLHKVPAKSRTRGFPAVTELAVPVSPFRNSECEVLEELDSHLFSS